MTTLPGKKSRKTVIETWLSKASTNLPCLIEWSLNRFIPSSKTDVTDSGKGLLYVERRKREKFKPNYICKWYNVQWESNMIVSQDQQFIQETMTYNYKIRNLEINRNTGFLILIQGKENCNTKSLKFGHVQYLFHQQWSRYYMLVLHKFLTYFIIHFHHIL